MGLDTYLVRYKVKNPRSDHAEGYDIGEKRIVTDSAESAAIYLCKTYGVEPERIISTTLDNPKIEHCKTCLQPLPRR